MPKVPFEVAHTHQVSLDSEPPPSFQDGFRWRFPK
jgi:hypothetical protein